MPPIMELMFARMLLIPPMVMLTALDCAGVKASWLILTCTVFIRLPVAEIVSPSSAVVAESKTNAACALFVGIATIKMNAKNILTNITPMRDALIFLIIRFLIVR